MKNILFLFDVNGTLIKKKLENDKAYINALKDLFEIEDPFNGIETTARSDKAIFKDFLKKINTTYTDTIFDKFLTHYEKMLEKLKEENIWGKNDNVDKFIKKVVEKECDLALLTGNLEVGAKYKLEAIDVWRYFETGGFGEDAEIRTDIADAALKKVKKYYNVDSYRKIIIVGDTEKDIKVANYLNAVSIIFYADNNLKKKLSQHNPDYLINDFTQIINEIDNF